MKAAIYSRKSKFSPKGESIDNQIQMCKNYANLNITDKEITEFYIYEDEGFTGGNINRPEFQRLMKDVANKKFNILICYRLDRISRNVADFSNTLEKLQNYEIDFVSIKEQFDTTTPMGRAMIYISSVFAQLERETIAERIRDNMLELSKSGRWLGGTPPLGYTSKQINFFDENMNERSMSKLTSLPEELQLVKIIFDKYLELKSLSKVETYLLEHYYQTRRGTNFDKGKLKRILTNTVYAKSSDDLMEYLSAQGITTCGEPDGIHGLLTYNKLKPAVSKNGKTSRDFRDTSDWIAAVSSHSGIIDAKDWIQAQDILFKNKDRFIVSARTHNALLTGIIKCEKCGSRMRILHGQVSKKTGAKMYYYTCTLKKDSKGLRCDNSNGKTSNIDSIVINSIRNLGLNKMHLINNLIEINTKKATKDTKDSSTDMLKDNIEAKRKQIDILLTKLSLDSDLTDIIFNKIKLLKDELKVLNVKLKDIEISKSNITQNEINLSFIKLLLNKCSIIDTLSFDEKKELIGGITETITWNGERNQLNIKFIGSRNS